MKTCAVLFCLLSLLLCACQPPASAPPPVSPASLNGHWILQELDGAPAGQPPIELHLDTATGLVHGFAGVNRYRGQVTLHDNRLEFKMMITTKMAGPRMEEEDRYLRLLQEMPRYQLDGPRLLLEAPSSGIRAVFLPAPPASPSPR